VQVTRHLNSAVSEQSGINTVMERHDDLAALNA